MRKYKFMEAATSGITQRAHMVDTYMYTHDLDVLQQRLILFVVWGMIQMFPRLGISRSTKEIQLRETSSLAHEDNRDIRFYDLSAGISNQYIVAMDFPNFDSTVPPALRYRGTCMSIIMAFYDRGQTTDPCACHIIL